jgi:DNA-binding CsgD family transcriptional regulator
VNRVGPLQSPILIGRDDLLELAERRIADAAAGRGQSLLLAGEAGIGKTRMLRAVLRKAAAAGFRVAKSDLAPQDRQLPLASILDLARTMRGDAAFGSLGDDLLAPQGGLAGQPGQPVLAGQPGQAALAGPGPDNLGSRRLMVRDIAQRIVETIDRPTMLAFEDLQWADEVSLEVIGELVRLGQELPLFVVGAYRPDELPPDSAHREWRARLLGQRLGEEARLAPLTYEQTAIMITLILGTGLPAPREVVRAVHQRTDGVPLYIEELLGALSEEARQDDRAIRDAAVPDTVEDAILARVTRLSDEARAVARAGAVIGRCFVPEVLAGIMDRPVTELEAPLEELVASGFLYRFGAVDSGYHDYRHQLLRDTLYRSVPASELRRLHARAGEFGASLEGQSEVHASVHFERAGLRGQAYRAALAGARAASAVSSRREAFELYARAVANLPEGLPALEMAELYTGYQEAASAVDNVAIATETAETARRYYLEAGRPLEAASMLLWAAGMARRDVRPIAERLAILDQARAELDALPESPDRDRAVVDYLLMRSIAELDALRVDEATATLAGAERLAESTADEELCADVAYWQAAADVLAGRVGDGLTATLRLARHARDAGNESTGVTAYRNAALLATRVMDYAVAATGLHEGLRYADEIEQSYCRHMMAAASALAAWAGGQWDEAVSIAEQELVEPASRRGGLGARDALGYVALGRGDVERARHLLDDSLAIGRTSGEVALVLSPLWGLAEAALVAGEPAVAVAHCDLARDLAAQTGERALLIPFVVTGTRAHLAARRPEAAERWVQQVTGLLGGWETLARPAIDHADGLLRLAAGSTVSARAALQEAIEGWDRRGRAWEAAWARADLATCLVRGNRHADAIPVLASLRAAAARLGSGPLLARADELGSAARSRSTSAEPWRPLSAREYEVARLVAEGMTNAEIAEALTLSPKTVSAHLEHILAKLGAMRRTEVAAWVTAIRPPSPTASVATEVGRPTTTGGHR